MVVMTMVGCHVARTRIKRRQRWNADYAREVLARMRRSGKNRSEMARDLGVSPQRLWWWEKRLGAESDSTGDTQPAFVEVMLPQPQRTLGSSFTVSNDSGWRVEVRPGFDASELRRLLHSLEGREC